ncbi:hypothetical protein GF312_12725, partial [Candidatus Poribacteria bacterium]|nr:hypothetical protein [Candidatus Poribacteria bacterium]
MNKNLYQKNHPAEFWKLPYQINDKVEWDNLCKSASSSLPVEAQNENIEKILQNTLGEEQFGKDQWKLSKTRRLFYDIKPFIPKRI